MTSSPPAHAEAAVAAPFGRRAFARLFDIAVVGVVAVPVLTLTLRDDHDGGVRFPIVVIVLYGLLPALFEARLLARSGATPGKRLSGLLVTRGATSAPPNLLRSFARALLTWSVPALAVLLLGGPVVAAVIVVVFGPAAIPGLRRDLGDLVSGTHVVYIGDVADEIDPVDDKEIPG
ncbi:unannotated protein [freshwater metagenome]|uniref:Unannotated protein n=1 Tax=freshwater metagenome TaxID=449393 RepID=A0A6J7AUU7_9ZZZZ